MAGLFDTLALGSRSLSTYRKAIDTTGHNLANVNTPGYTRQRLVIESVTTDGGTLGEVGSGAEAVKIVRLRNEFATRQLQAEASIEGSLSVKQEALQSALTALQESIDRNGGSGTSTKGISQALSDFFAAMQAVSTDPASIAERQVALQKAQELANRFNLADSRLGGLQGSLSDRVQDEAGQVNALAAEIANLNAAIVSEEALSDGYANDLRDARQVKLDALAKLVKVDSSEQEDGSINVVLDGSLLVDGPGQSNSIETFDPGNGQLLVRIAGQGAALASPGGSIGGAIAVRDTQLAHVRGEIDSLAQAFIAEVNQIHAAGFSLSGSTGANFFTGSNASDIAVSSVLLSDPSLLQAAAVPGEPGDNTVIRGIAQLSSKAHAALEGQTFSARHAQTVAGLAEEVAGARTELEDQQAVSQFLRNQRDAVAGVSIDEEMANLMMFQKAFQASAKLITTTDEMLATILEM
jgi:flagellar hook-associated protein 1 FlgK